MSTKNSIWRITGVKVCPVCKVEKSVEEFKLNNQGIPGWCGPCTTEKQRVYQAARRSENKERTADWHRKIKYNLTPDDYTYMVLEQGGACAICHQVSDGLCVDHDHETGQVRGLLCRTCNSGIGMLKDDILMVQSALTYLTKYKKEED